MARKTNGAADPMAPRLRKPHQQQALPEMEDVKVRSIQNALASLSEVRAQLNELRQQEAGLMQRTLDLMRKHEKTSCRAHGVEVFRVPGEEKLRVRTSKEPATAETGDEQDDDYEQPSLANA